MAASGSANISTISYTGRARSQNLGEGSLICDLDLGFEPRTSKEEETR